MSKQVDNSRPSLGGPTSRHWRRHSLRVAGLLLVITAMTAGWQVWAQAQRRERDARVEEARQAVSQGRVATARSLLAALARRYPRDGEIQLNLGLSELSLGRLDEALSALERVPPGSPEAVPAVVHRCRLLLNDGRLAAVETLITPELLSDPDPMAVEAYHQLANCYKLQGRKDDAIQLYRHALQRMGRPVEMLRELSDINYRLMIGSVRTILERGRQLNPDDDRVWLGLAALETTMGHFEEADQWLGRCLATRPKDPAVWMARLRWAQAADQPVLAYETLEHLPADALASGELWELGGWFARHQGDVGLEWRMLEAALNGEHANRPEILGRLAVIAQDSGKPDAAAELRARKARYDRSLRDFAEILFSPNPAAQAQRLSELATALGRPSEAGFWAGVARGDDTATLVSAPAPPPPRTPPSEGTLRTRLAALGISGANLRGTGRPQNHALALPRFVDRAASSGLVFQYDPGMLGFGRSIVETTGGGVALLDFDRDGWLDVFLVQGGAFPPPAETHSRDRLFRNQCDGSFADVTDASGIPLMTGGYGIGVTAGDGDGDGWTDLLVTRWGSLQVLRNQGDGTFHDATAQWGLDGAIECPSSAAFADLDSDGDLDLYVCQYVVYDPADPLQKPSEGGPNYASPLRHQSVPDRLYRNDAGRFTDVSLESGVAALPSHGRGLGVLACDVDGDNALDLYVTNDMSPNFLFRNLGGLRFEESAELSGVAAGSAGGYQGSMGIAAGDLDEDGRLDLAITNYMGEGMALYRGLGDGLFAEQSAGAGLLAPTRYMLGFGTALADLNDDGHLDLAVANGHVIDFEPNVPFRMPCQLMLGDGQGRLYDMTEQAGPAWTQPRVGRAMACGDLDNDGRLDLLVVFHDAPVALLQNQTAPAGRSLTLALEASATAPSAEGARVTIRQGQRSLTAWRFAGGSFQSASDPRLHFGLGSAAAVDSIEICWPSGNTQEYAGAAAGTAWRLREGDPVFYPLEGYDSPAEVAIDEREVTAP